jgi:hypothetical protein
MHCYAVKENDEKWRLDFPSKQEGSEMCSPFWKRPTVGALSRGRGDFEKVVIPAQAGIQPFDKFRVTMLSW